MLLAAGWLATCLGGTLTPVLWTLWTVLDSLIYGDDFTLLEFAMCFFSIAVCGPMALALLAGIGDGWRDARKWK